MAQTQISEKLGASGSVFGADQRYNPQMSAFDLSRKLATTISEGAIVPLDVIRLLPGDKIDYNCRFLLDAMPQVVPPQTNYKLILQLWQTDLLDLWKGAETFVTKGRNANIEMSIPTIEYDGLYSDDKSLVDENADGYYVTTPHGLPTALGLPPCRYSLDDEHIDHTPMYLPYVEKFDADDTTSPVTHFHASADEVNALIPFFYQKICRTMLPTNLLQNCKVWFPDDISNDDWRIAPDGSNLTTDGHFVPMGTTMPDAGSEVANFVPHAGNDENKDNCVNLWQTRYVQYGDDLFTTAKPWLVRGDEQTLDMDVTGINMGLYDKVDYEGTAKMLADCDGKTWASLSDAQKKAYTDAVGINFTYTGAGFNNIYSAGGARPANDGTWDISKLSDQSKRPGINVSSHGTSPFGTGDVSAVGLNGVLGGNNSTYTINGITNRYAVLKGEDVANALGVQFIGTPKVSMTANTLRSLIAVSIKDEIDALSNGNYDSHVRIHYGVNPKHHDFEPRYVGGLVDYINFSSVMQTSASTDSQPIGSVGGIGGSSAGGYLGHIESDDFGYAMVVAYIVPEVTYTDGIDREWTDVTNDTLWYPEWSNLGFQPLLNKEIKVTGNQSTDDDLFGYQTRGIEYKQRRNKVSGLFQLSPAEDRMFSAYTQAREFDSTPELSNEFTTCSPRNMRRDYLAFPEMPTYRFQFASDVKAIRPLPYKSIPARFGM